MYERLAPGYDRRVRAVEGVRREAVSLLGLKAGDNVLDIGCGTGISFPLLEESVGPEGRIFGVDLSGDMLGKARERVDAAGWDNVTLVQSAIEDAEIPVEANAVLFHFTHDIMRTPAALDNVFRHVRPGGGVVSAGGKWAPWWLGPVNLVWWRISRRY
ncbi:MAG: methyltransferase domain-containing protein, partial [Gemmatimonadota bacterium]